METKEFDGMKKSFINPVAWGSESLLTQGFAGKAFTMAEILLSLTIIGVVAAITLPSLMGNINERTWNTQRKALHARMSQAIAMMPQLNGYGTYAIDADGSVTADTAAEAFLTEGLSKVLKINNICDNEHLADCGLPTSINVGLTSIHPALGDINSTSINFPTKLSELNSTLYYNRNYKGPKIDFKAAAFETQNGESIAVFYNPNCQVKPEMFGVQDSFYLQDKMCANFVVDLNGDKGPNIAGKDISFMTAFYSDEPVVVAPKPRWETGGFDYPDSALKACAKFDSTTRLPNKEEMSAIILNHKGYGLDTGAGYWALPIKMNTFDYGTGAFTELSGGVVDVFGSVRIEAYIDWCYLCVDR